MKVNTKIRYGLRTVVEIGSPQNKEGILQKEIAKRQEISEKYLDPIISALKASGIIRNVAGKKSGYLLNKPANKITVLDVFQSFEKTPELVDCTSRIDFCHRSDKCVTREFWCGLNTVIYDFCKNTTIKSLVKRSLELNAAFEDALGLLGTRENKKADVKKFNTSVN